MGQFDLAEQALTQAQAQRLTAPARLTTPYSADAPLLDLTRAELLMARGQAEQAAKVTAVALVKNGAYRPLAYQHIKALQAANQAEEALKFINERQRIWTADGTLFALKAQAHQALGHKAESFLAQAEAYALADRIGAAIEQLQLAQRQGKTDFFTLSIIDARLRELRARQTRETSRQ
jgi:predicted Zn-dependent protease